MYSTLGRKRISTETHGTSRDNRRTGLGEKEIQYHSAESEGEWRGIPWRRKKHDIMEVRCMLAGVQLTDIDVKTASNPTEQSRTWKHSRYRVFHTVALTVQGIQTYMSVGFFDITLYIHILLLYRVSIPIYMGMDTLYKEGIIYLKANFITNLLSSTFLKR